MCFSQLKQLGLAVQMYAADNDDGLPNRFTFGGENETSEFVNATQPYIKNYQILVCPEEVEAFKAASNPSPPPGAKHHMSYVHCLSLKGVIPDFNKGNRFFCPKTSNLELSQTPYMREPIESFGNPEGDQPGPALLSAHRHYPNISYLDGHVRGKTRLDINTQL